MKLHFFVCFHLIVVVILFLSFSDQRNSVFQASFGSNEPKPHFAGKIQNVTVHVGREAVLECPVNHLGHYKVHIILYIFNYLKVGK